MSTAGPVTRRSRPRPADLGGRGYHPVAGIAPRDGSHLRRCLGSRAKAATLGALARVEPPHPIRGRSLPRVPRSPRRCSCSSVPSLVRPSGRARRHQVRVDEEVAVPASARCSSMPRRMDRPAPSGRGPTARRGRYAHSGSQHPAGDFRSAGDAPARPPRAGAGCFRRAPAAAGPVRRRGDHPMRPRPRPANTAIRSPSRVWNSLRRRLYRSSQKPADGKRCRSPVSRSDSGASWQRLDALVEERLDLPSEQRIRGLVAPRRSASVTARVRRRSSACSDSIAAGGCPVPLGGQSEAVRPPPWLSATAGHCAARGGVEAHRRWRPRDCAGHRSHTVARATPVEVRGASPSASSRSSARGLPSPPSRGTPLPRSATASYLSSRSPSRRPPPCRRCPAHAAGPTGRRAVALRPRLRQARGS